MGLNNRGSVAHWSSAGLGYSSEHTVLHSGFYEGMFDYGLNSIGDAANYAKIKYYQSGRYISEIYGFILLGDAAMEAVPQSSPLSVGLTRFEAIPLDNAARLEWDTQTELGTAGYTIKRGQNGSFDYLSDSNGNIFINSEGGPAEGYEYTFTDETAVNGEFYTYQLIEILIDASEVVVADTTVTIGIVPTNTPIVVNAGGINGGSSNTTGATATATSISVSTASATTPPTPLPNNALSPAATPFPTQVSLPATNVNQVAGNSESESQSNSNQPLAQEEPQANQSENAGVGVAVALAQEEPAGYPGPDTAEPEAGESLDFPETNPGSDLEGAATDNENPAAPEVIGNSPYPAGEPSSNPASGTPNAAADESAGFEGKLYLWVAFIAALMIFTAAVLGAILLYTRQRNQE